MRDFSFVFTIFFMLIGPIKLIPTFGAVTRGVDAQFKKETALWATVIAAVLCATVALAGGLVLSKYRISIDALRLMGGLVIVMAALEVIFKKSQPPTTGPSKPTAIQLAASPVAVPMIVPPAGVVAILVFTQHPGTGLAVGISLAVMMVLNFLVMRFIDRILSTRGLILILTVAASVLLFVQACLGTEMILTALKSLGLFNATGTFNLLGPPGG